MKSKWTLGVMLGLLAASVTTGCATLPPTPAAGEGAGIQVATEGWIRVVRGVNQTSCDASAIGHGNDPKVGPKQDLTDLSVSCSKNKRDTVRELRQFLPNPHVCASTLKELRKARREVVVVRDPNDDNPFHCLLSTITPNQFVSRSRWYN